MLFKIKEIGDEGLPLNLAVTADWLASKCPDLDAVPGLGGLTVRGQLLAGGDDVFLRGSLRGVLETTCSRCLEKAREKIDIPLAVTFSPRSDETIDEDEEDDEDTDVAFFDGDEIDLSDEIRDQILLAFPIKPLCQDDCAGLCPVCGGNRNQVPCDCRPGQTAARTSLAAVLGKLKV
jgi:uncharacterized protein